MLLPIIVHMGSGIFPSRARPNHARGAQTRTRSGTPSGLGRTCYSLRAVSFDHLVGEDRHRCAGHQPGQCGAPAGLGCEQGQHRGSDVQGNKPGEKGRGGGQSGRFDQLALNVLIQVLHEGSSILLMRIGSALCSPPELTEAGEEVHTARLLAGA
jgi:hypothetical protein